jgi:parallel beta-helix repeat protein
MTTGSDPPVDFPRGSLYLRAMSYRNVVRTILMTGLAAFAVLHAAHAATRTVTTVGTDAGDCESSACRTIQFAIDQASSDDVVTIGSGTYTEQLTIASKALTLQGEDSEQTVLQATTTGAVNGQNTITITGSDKVTIDSLTIRHGDIGISSTATVSVTNAILTHNGYDGAPYPSGIAQADAATFYGTHATDGGAIVVTGGSGGEISSTLIYENDRGIEITDGSAYLIKENTIRNNIRPAIHLASSTGDGSAGNRDATIESNTISDHLDVGIFLVGAKGVTISKNTIEGSWNSGVMLQHAAEVTVDQNTFDGNNSSTFNGQGLQGEAWGSIATEGNSIAAPASFLLTVTTNLIGNTGQGRASSATAIRLTADSPDVEIQGNQFVTYGTAVHVVAQATTTDVHFNAFAGGLVGIQNDDTTGRVSAERNWWGCASGPGNAGCDSIVGSVDSDSVLSVAYPAALTLKPAVIPLALGATEQLQVNGTLLSEETIVVTGECLFSMLDESVATVDASGLVTAEGDGTSAVTASCFDSSLFAVATVAAGSTAAAVSEAAGVTSASSAASSGVTTGNWAVGGSGFGFSCALQPQQGVIEAWKSPGMIGAAMLILTLGIMGVARSGMRRTAPTSS